MATYTGGTNAVKTKLEGLRCVLDGQWATFDKDPTKSASNENNTFKALQGVFVDIIHHAKGDISSDDGGSGGKAGEAQAVVKAAAIKLVRAAIIVQSHYLPITII